MTVASFGDKSGRTVDRIIIEFGKVKITYSTNSPEVVLAHVEGEALSCDPAKLEAAIEAFFWKEF
jgi:hypothetical protein